MAVSLVRSRAMITKTLSRTEWEEVPDGAVLQEEGIVVETGAYEDLRRRFPTVPVVGTGRASTPICTPRGPSVTRRPGTPSRAAAGAGTTPRRWCRPRRTA